MPHCDNNSKKPTGKPAFFFKFHKEQGNDQSKGSNSERPEYDLGKQLLLAYIIPEDDIHWPFKRQPF